MTANAIDHATYLIKNGRVLAYPTEGVFGLGADPWQLAPVQQIRYIKSRPPSQGFIIIAAYWQQVSFLVDSAIDPAVLDYCLQTWPGPITWLLPASTYAPYTVTGDSDRIAIRLTKHTIARALTLSCGPLISTSANLRGQPALTDESAVHDQLDSWVDYVLSGKVGDLQGATDMRDAITGERIR